MVDSIRHPLPYLRSMPRYLPFLALTSQPNCYRDLLSSKLPILSPSIPLLHPVTWETSLKSKLMMMQDSI